MRPSAFAARREAERRQGSPVIWAALVVSAGLTLGLVAGLAMTRRLARYEVVGQSMEPSLSNGAWVLVDLQAYRTRAPSPGDVVVAADPREPGRTLVKRIAAVLPDGTVEVRGDMEARSTDSRHFGPIAAALLQGRVRWRYWPSPGWVR